MKRYPVIPTGCRFVVFPTSCTGGYIHMKAAMSTKALNKVIHWVDVGHSIVLTLLVGFLTSGVIISVFLRYVFNIAFTWSEELLTISFVATTFLGASLGMREKEHIAIDYFTSKLPRLHKVINTLVMLIVIVVAVFAFDNSLKWISKVGKIPSPATGVPNGTFYLVVPISFAFTIFYAIINILAEFISIDPPTTKSRYEEYSVTPIRKEEQP